jgi:phage gpG-like protein
MKSFTLDGFAAHLVKLVTEVEVEKRHLLEKAAQIVEDEAKAEIGHRQGEAGPFPAWEPLADTTINGFKGHPGKADLGCSPPDCDPLLREGETRGSIQHVVAGDTAYVGSNSQVAVWDELGTSKMPARSFLGGAAFRKKDEIGRMAGRDMVMVLAGGSTKTEIP